MNSRKFLSDRSLLAAEGEKMVEALGDSGFIKKVVLVSLVLRGVAASQLSRACGVSERTLIRWVKSVDESGYESLKAKKKEGRPTFLSEPQKSEITRIINSAPEKYGYSCWTGTTLSDFIQKNYGVSLCVRQCQRILKERRTGE